MLVVWNEFIKDQVELYNDADLIGACCETIATVRECVPEHEEDYPTAPPICMEACRMLGETLYAKHPLAALYALSQFPAAFLAFRNIEVVELFENACKRPFGGHERFLEMFLKKWIDMEVASMPRSLYLGTAAATRTKVQSPRPPSSSPDDANYHQVLSLKVASWKMNPLFAAIELGEHTDNPEDFAKVYAQICTTPSLSLQHWLLRLEFVQIIIDHLNQLFSHLNDAEGLGSFLNLCSVALEAFIKEGQTVSVVSMAVVLRGLLYSVAGLHDFNEQRACQQVERLLKNADSINPQFASNEDVQASVVLAAKHLIQSLSGDGKRRDMNLLLQHYLQDGCKVKPQTWLHFLLEGTINNAWPALLLCPGVEQPPMVGGGDEVDALMFGLLSGNFKDLAEAESRVAQLGNREPLAFSGMLQYGLGVLAAQSDVRESDRLWASLKASIKSPGPAAKKILVCCTLLGLIKRAGMAPEDATRVLSESLESGTDQRLNVWLAVVLNVALNLKARRSPTVDVDEGRGGSHRFGPNSVFGACLDLIYERSPCSPLILESLSQVNVLPRLDWSFVSSEGGSGAALVKLAWSHYRSKTFDGSVYINEGLLELLIKDVEREPRCLLGKLGKVVDFLDCLSTKDDGLRRFLTAYSDKCVVDGKLLSLILGSSAISNCGQDDVALLLRPLMAHRRDLLVMESWAASKLPVTLPGDPVVDFFRTKSLRDAIIACQLEPESLSTVAAALADRRILSELALNVMFCIEDSPSSCPLIFSLLREVVNSQTHPFIRSIVWEESNRLAWLQLLHSTDAERRKDAISLQSKLRRVDALFPSLGLEEEQYWTT